MGWGLHRIVEIFSFLLAQKSFLLYFVGGTRDWLSLAGGGIHVSDLFNNKLNLEEYCLATYFFMNQENSNSEIYEEAEDISLSDSKEKVASKVKEPVRQTVELLFPPEDF